MAAAEPATTPSAPVDVASQVASRMPSNALSRLVERPLSSPNTSRSGGLLVVSLEALHLMSEHTRRAHAAPVWTALLESLGEALKVWVRKLEKASGVMDRAGRGKEEREEGEEEEEEEEEKERRAPSSKARRRQVMGARRRGALARLPSPCRQLQALEDSGDGIVTHVRSASADASVGTRALRVAHSRGRQVATAPDAQRRCPLAHPRARGACGPRRCRRAPSTAAAVLANPPPNASPAEDQRLLNRISPMIDCVFGSAAAAASGQTRKRARRRPSCPLHPRHRCAARMRCGLVSRCALGHTSLCEPSAPSFRHANPSRRIPSTRAMFSRRSLRSSTSLDPAWCSSYPPRESTAARVPARW